MKSAMKPVNAVIKEVRSESPYVRTLRFALSDGFHEQVQASASTPALAPASASASITVHAPAPIPNPISGQYAMVWVRGVDEIPMGYSSIDEITVHMVGQATNALGNLKIGDSVGIRGPLGNGFKLVGDRILLIGGGVGVAPLAFLGDFARKKGIEVTTLVGFRSAQDAILLGRLKALGDLIITTDDGSLGISGFASAGLKDLDLESFSQIYLCGPELMMWDIISRTRDHTGKIQASINRYIKCAVGVCGSCCLDPGGLKVCVEGPVVSAERLLDGEFGRYRRGPTGGRESCKG